MSYEPYKGDLPPHPRFHPSMLHGTATAYDIWKIQERGAMFIIARHGDVRRHDHR